MQFQKKIYLLSAISAVFFVLFLFFLTWPFFQKIQNNSAEIIRQKEKLASFQLETEAMENFKSRYETVKKDLAKADSLFVNSELPLDFFVFLEKNSSELGLDMGVSSQGGGESSSGWHTSFFQVTLSGKYSKFLEFLKKLQDSPYLIQVQTLGVSKSLDPQGKTGSKNIKASLSLKVFTK